MTMDGTNVSAVTGIKLGDAPDDADDEEVPADD